MSEKVLDEGEVENTHKDDGFESQIISGYLEKTVTDLMQSDPEMKNMVANLRTTFDRIDSDFKKASEYVLEIARKLDESGRCQRSEICRVIKYILHDKIKKGKISTKWIEECLPKEYKREYNKSEQTSLSNKKLEIVVDGDSGELLLDEQTKDAFHLTFARKINDDSVKTKNNKKIELHELINPNKIKINTSCSGCQQLLHNTIKFQDNMGKILGPISAYELSNNPEKFIINKKQKVMIQNGLEKCKEFCSLAFNESGLLIKVTTDTLVEAK
jgi:hypothetical protein